MSDEEIDTFQARLRRMIARRRGEPRFARLIEHLEALSNSSDSDAALDDIPEVTGPKRTRKRKEKIDFNNSSWGRLIADPEVNNPESTAGRTFRLRFRVPFPIFDKVLAPLMVTKNIFKADNKMTRVPLKFKLLACLRILGRGLCFDDITDIIGIPVSTMHAIFNDAAVYSSILCCTFLQARCGRSMQRRGVVLS